MTMIMSLNRLTKYLKFESKSIVVRKLRKILQVYWQLLSIVTSITFINSKQKQLMKLNFIYRCNEKSPES